MPGPNQKFNDTGVSRPNLTLFYLQAKQKLKKAKIEKFLGKTKVGKAVSAARKLLN